MEQYTFLSVDDILTPAVSEAINASDSQLTAMQDTQLIAFTKWLSGELQRKAYSKNGEGLSFMKKTSAFKTYPKTTLNGIVLAGAASMTLTSSTNWDTSGKSVIETVKNALDFVDHENNAANVLTVSTATGADVVSMAHASGEKIHKLYPLPTDFAKMLEDGFRINDIPYDYCQCRGFPIHRKYTVYRGYVLLPRGEQNSDVTLWYERTQTAITARTGDGSTTDIPDKALRWAIEMTLFHLFKIRRKRGDLQTTDQLAERYLDEFLAYDSMFSENNSMTFG